MACRLTGLLLLFIVFSGGQTAPLTKYFVAFLYKGSAFTSMPAESPERKANHQHHIAYIERMQSEGKLLTYGPILDAGDLRGMYVFKANSIEEARGWANAEPSVAIGMIEMRVYPWLAPTNLIPSGK